MIGSLTHTMHSLQGRIGADEPPRITVITVVFNGSTFIEDTILSVVRQTYTNLEYIVIDGGSTDGTVDIIQKYADKIDYWHSEKDAGIYDAMNKGLQKATGRWVNFMNAGDVFHGVDTVSEIFAAGTQTAAVIYGGVEIVYPDLVRIQHPGDPAKLWQGMQFCHQSAFTDVIYHQSHPFDIRYRIAADLAFFYQAYQAQMTFSDCGKVISRVITGGVSEANRVKAILSSRDAVCGRRWRPFIRLYYIGRIISAMLRTLAKRCLPRALVRKLILLK